MDPQKPTLKTSNQKGLDSIRILVLGGRSEDLSLYQEILNEDSTRSYLFSYPPALETALQVLVQDSIDLVLFDVNEKEGFGLEAFFKLRVHSSAMPVVVISGENQKSIAVEVLKNGAQDCLEREQLTSVGFCQAIGNAIERNRAIRREFKMLVAELEKTKAHLQGLSDQDPLTGLLNRKGLQQVLSSEVELVREGWSDLIVLLIDLDDFKRINLTWGHVAGDIVLNEIAKKLRSTLMKRQYIGRIGGNQFMVLAPQASHESGRRLAESVRLGISGEPISLSAGSAITITASIGAVVITKETSSIDELLTKVHLALHKSKNLGKNRVFFDVSDEDVQGKEMSALSAVLAAMRSGNQFHTVKQPIFRLSDLEMIGYEFLSRSSIDVFEMPADFFRVCQEDNMLTLVDHLCFKNCVKAGKLLSPKLQRHLNLFPSTIIDIPVKHLLESFPRNKSKQRYCIEISEQQIIGDPSYLVKSVNEFKREGLLIAIDDVGFGRSCLENLILLEPHVVKIDKLWIHDIAKDKTRIQSLKRLLKVTSALGADVVAEGVESHDDLEELRRLGVPNGQGYLLGKPA